MSRLAPPKPLNNEQIEQSLDILASGTITYAQLSKLAVGLTIADEQAGYGPDMDDFACACAAGERAYNASLPDDEPPYSGATIGREDQPSWMRSFNDLSIRGAS
jgi:hypothetical protein